MNGTSKKGMTLFVTLGFILSVLAVFAPVGATAGRAGNFTVNTPTFTNATGAPITEANLSDVVSVIGNASIAAAGVNVTLFKMMLTINDVAITPDTTEAPLDIGDFAENTWSWTPATYGTFTVNVTAINGTDTANQTVSSTQFTVKGHDLTLGALTVTPATGYIDLTDFTFTAVVNNAGNAAGEANVSFLLDNTTSVGFAVVNVPAVTANAVLTGKITGTTDGNHTVTAKLVDITTTYSTSGNVSLMTPVAHGVVNTLTATPASVTITKGASVAVTITANVTNEGQLDIVDGVMSFYDTDTTTAVFTSAPTNLSVGASTDVVYIWTVTDTVALGDHIFYVQLGTETIDTTLNATVTVIGVANVTISNLVASPTAAFEGENVTFTVTLFNNGTLTAVNQTITWYDGATQIGTTTNVTVTKGDTPTKTLVWALPSVDLDTNKTIKAMIGTAFMTVNVTDKNKAPKIEMTAFTVDTGRIGDNVTMTATVKNNGTGDAIGLIVDFYDGATKVGSAAAINLTVQSSKDVSISYKLAGAADANHTFFAKGLGAEKNVTKSVGHTLAPAAIQIVSFTVKPTKKEGQPKDSTQEYKVTITLKNTGEVMGIAILNLTEKGKLITPISVPVLIDANGNTTQTYTWKVKGEGDHTCVATLTGNVGTPSTMSVKATLKYTPGFEVLALIGAIVAALILVRRRKN